jgi:Bacteriophage tail sheath protein
MPEYLAPGVYVEEVSFRAKSIEGVSTSVAGFIGPTRYGPTAGEPELLTSFADFERIYGGIDRLTFERPDARTEEEQDNYMAHAVRAFFDNGGSKLYVTRVYEPLDPNDPDSGKADALVDSPLTLMLRARFPGQAGEMRVVFAVKTSANLLAAQPGAAPRVNGVRQYDVVFIKEALNPPVPLSPVGAIQEGLYDVVRDGETLAFDNASPGLVHPSDLDPARHRVHLVTLTVRVLRPGRFEDEQVWDNLSPHPQSRNALLDLFTQTPESRLRYLTVPFAIVSKQAMTTSGARLTEALLGNAVLGALYLSLYTDDERQSLSPKTERPSPTALEQMFRLSGGRDGRLPTHEAYRGQEAQRDTNSGVLAESTGLETFADVEEISIVAAPGYSKKSSLVEDNTARWSQIVQYLLTHCQIRMRYRVAVLDSPDGQVVSEIQDFRGKFDSTHAALYYPWITILDPLDPDGQKEIDLPPSGYVAGIYARTDVLHGVFKAPANEVVLGAIGFETLLNKAQQDVLNPLGINCFRFFEGRGFRLWGARTISSDPEWKYISVRRYFAYLEHSIDRGTQWAVFENNNEPLWANIRRTVEDFLFNEWRNGALMGLKPEQAFFVRCDRSTMTQNDLDNGRLVCLIGVAVVKPAEFVIFRIGQFTADSRR